MLKYLSPLVVVCLVSFGVIADEVDDKIDRQVSNPSVSVLTPENRVIGSGTVFVKDKKAYVLTCGHLFPGMRSVEKIRVDQADGTTKEVEKVVWQNPKISQTIFRDNKEIAERIALCEVILYSPVEEEGGMDLALLRVFEEDFIKQGAKFVSDDKLVRKNLDLVHVGALFGIPSCIVKGNISRLDYKYKGQPFNLAILNGRPGSSGGGVFAIEKSDYVYVGMTVRGDNAGLMMLKTPGHIRKWLKDNKMEDIIN